MGRAGMQSAILLGCGCRMTTCCHVKSNGVHAASSQVPVSSISTLIGALSHRTVFSVLRSPVPLTKHESLLGVKQPPQTTASD